jgi:hypothetical protein
MSYSLPVMGSLSLYRHNFCEQIATTPKTGSKPFRQQRDDARTTARVGETAVVDRARAMQGLIACPERETEPTEVGFTAAGLELQS